MNFRKFFKLWGPVVFWCGVIFTLSSIPTLPKVEIIWWDFILKKSGHILEYAILYFLVFRATEGKVKSAKLKVKSLTTPFLFGFIYAISDEYHQGFVPGRTARVTDVGFDILGMVAAYLIIKQKTIKK